MHHAFGSLAIIQNVSFSHLPDVIPQTPFWEMLPEHFNLGAREWDRIQQDYMVLIARVVSRHIPALAFLADLDRPIHGPYSQSLTQENKVVPLQVLDKNEQAYKDVVDILDYYEKVVTDVHEAADMDMQGGKCHIGGDQLTRERFSGAKCLRIGGINGTQRFIHLGPITFEYLHLMMKLMEICFKWLYSDVSEHSLGSMKSEKTRIKRTNVDPDVRKAYDADKDFFVSFVDAYIVEALLEYFGMDSVYSAPTKHIPPPDAMPEEMLEWSKVTMSNFLKEMVPKPKVVVTINQDEVVDEGQVFQVVLANGQRLNLMRRNIVPAEDHVKNYGHRVLEFGLLFKDWLDLIKLPDCDRGIALLKLTMPILKASNNLSKYSYEIMRLLVHQLCSLSERMAHEEFYGMFVNTRRQVDSHVAVDDRMEWHVAKVKKHVKHMYSNKTDANISKRSLAFAGMLDISSNYDKVTGVIVRAKKHSVKSAYGDELSIIQDLRERRPFHYEARRVHEGFEQIARSCLQDLPIVQYYEWLETKLYKFATELGN